MARPLAELFLKGEVRLGQMTLGEHRISECPGDHRLGEMVVCREQLAGQLHLSESFNILPHEHSTEGPDRCHCTLERSCFIQSHCKGFWVVSLAG